MILEEDGYLKYEAKSNHPKLTKYNPYITQVWRANTDFPPVISLETVLRYIAKYTLKGEKGSSHLDELLRNCGEEVDEIQLEEFSFDS